MALPPYYPSQHTDERIAFWLVAHVQQLDTHAKWSAQYFWRRDDEDKEYSGWLFRDYICAEEVLREWVKRGIVGKVEKTGTRIHEEPWDLLQNTIKEARSLVSIPLSEDAAEEFRVLNEPNRMLWFETVIESFTEHAVQFSMSLWAYKYQLTNLSLPKQLFYLLADRLDAKIRFVHEWFALESVTKRLEHGMRHGPLLAAVADDLKHELALLRTPSEQQIQSSCRSLFPVLEKAMRRHVETGSQGKKAKTLDDLIRRFESARTVSDDTIALLRFVAKPKRDYVEHGRDLPPSLAKLVVATTLELLVRLGEVNRPGAKPLEMT